MKFSIHKESRLGRRKNNEDRIAYCYSRDALLLVVADGMGGHLHGEVAAQIAVQLITGAFQREAAPRLDDPFHFLSASLASAHRAILDYSTERGIEEHEGPRTTCVACIVQDNIAYWVHAGDSRLYVIREGRLLAQTRDHSRVQMLLDEGTITEEEAARHPDRNRIFSCLGGAQPPQIDFSRKTPLHEGDIVLLCTDGFWSPLGNDRLVQGLSSAPVTLAMPRLMDEAETLAGNGCDNLSVVAIAWEDDYADDSTGPIETSTLPLDAHTLQMDGFGTSRPAETELTDDDIERAIAEIRTTIRKYSK